jgi:hypothetical protein
MKPDDMQADLVAALSEIRNPPLDGEANYGRYATLPACLETARQTLSKNNLAVLQMTYTDPDRLVTRIIHVSGLFVEDGGVPLLCENKANPQKMGSAITYARRYGLCAMLGIVGEEDDDGQRATPAQELPPSAKAPAKVDGPAEIYDEIPFDASPGAARPNWTAWVDDQVAGMEKHKNMAEHRLWSGTVRDHRERLEKEEPGEHARLLQCYTARKAKLENKEKTDAKIRED